MPVYHDLGAIPVTTTCYPLRVDENVGTLAKMFEVYCTISGRRYRVLCSRPHDLAIPLDPEGRQPLFFVESPARRFPLQVGSFVGDIHRGGSCNVDTFELTPHCHGTHTETVSHIADPFVAIASACPTALLLAKLISVTPTNASLCSESYRPALRHDDRVVTTEQLALDASSLGGATALMVRTLPNPSEKTGRRYSPESGAAFLTNEAVQAIVAAGIEHLIVDFPTVDRMDDDGLLSNHRLFWNVAPGAQTWTDDTAARRTITEMVYIPDTIPDGHYALTIAVPRWQSDAAPSRPFLYDLEPA